MSERETTETHKPMPAPVEHQRPQKAPKPPKPRKVERRRKGRKG
jgi:hypothetical protein